MNTVLYPRPASAIALRTHMALGAYKAVPRVSETARGLENWLSDMAMYAFAAAQQGGGLQWHNLGTALTAATKAVAACPTGGADIRAAITGATTTITRFEEATGTPAPAGIDDDLSPASTPASSPSPA
ncbi:hypothetical protein ACIQU4_27570 [Streptomyces sp. NPDC090741]|uniref:hypothetical protein n=1 Tax=Streptomyces sp. NPDC090741 TaxID=3365967 RepID=UPI0037F4F8F1